MATRKLPKLTLEQREKLKLAKRYCMDESIRYFKILNRIFFVVRRFWSLTFAFRVSFPNLFSDLNFAKIRTSWAEVGKGPVFGRTGRFFVADGDFPLEVLEALDTVHSKAT